MPSDCTDYIISTYNTVNNDNIKLKLDIQSLHFLKTNLENTNRTLNNLLKYSYYNYCVILFICVLLFCVCEQIYIYNVLIDKDCYIFINYLYYIFIILGIIQLFSIIFYFIISIK